MISPKSFFHDDMTEGIVYSLKTKDIHIALTLNNNGEGSGLPPYAEKDVMPDSELIYGAVPSEPDTRIDIIRRTTDGRETVARFTISNVPAYGEFYALTGGAALLLIAAAIAVFALKKHGAPRTGIEITIDGKTLAYTLSGKASLWDALNNARDDLINEKQDFDTYEAIEAVLSTFPAAETVLGGIWLTPVKDGVMLRGGSNVITQSPAGGYAVRDNAQTLAGLKIISGGLIISCTQKQ